MANYLTNTTDLTAIADAIREKTGESGSLIYPSGFVSAIEGISGGSSTYSVTLNLTNPRHADSSCGCAIYLILDSTKDDMGHFANEVFYTNISPTDSLTFNLDSSYYGIDISFFGISVAVGTISFTGKVSWEHTLFATDAFLIASDTVITVDGVDYDD